MSVGEALSRKTACREVRRAVESTGETRTAFADRAQVDSGTLGDFLDGKRWPQAPTRRKIEDALGWPAGRISDLEHGVSIPAETRSIEEAIRADPDLPEIAKSHLLSQVALLRHLRDGLPPELAQEQERMRQAAILTEKGTRILEALPDPVPPSPRKRKG